MRCYLVKANLGVGIVDRKFCGTNAQVSAFKKELIAKGYKRKEIIVTDVIIPDDKQGKLDFINNLIS